MRQSVPKCLCFLLAAAATGSAPAGAAAPPDARVSLKIGILQVARWKDGKPAAFSMFSDNGEIRGLKSGWTWETPDAPYDGFYTLVKKYRIPITFYVMPKYISPILYGYLPWKNTQDFRFSVSSWADWQLMHHLGCEIGSQTYSHADFRPDSIRLHLNDGVNRPWSDPDFEFSASRDTIAKYVGETPITVESSHGFEYVMPMARKYYPLTVPDLVRDPDVVSATFRLNTEVRRELDTLREAMAAGKWMIWSGHGIRTELGRKEESRYNYPWNDLRWKREHIRRYDGYTPTPYGVLDSVMAAVDASRDSLFIGTVKDVGRYLYERKHTALHVKQEKKGRVVFAPENSLNPEVFNYPLTFRLQSAGPGKTPKVSCQGKEIPVRKIGDGFLFEAVPNRGDIVITMDHSI